MKKTYWLTLSLVYLGVLAVGAGCSGGGGGGLGPSGNPTSTPKASPHATNTPPNAATQTALAINAILTLEARDVQTALALLPNGNLPGSVKTFVVGQITETGVAAQTVVVHSVQTETALVAQVLQTETAAVPVGTQTAVVAQLTETPAALQTLAAGVIQTESAVVPAAVETAQAQAAQTSLAPLPAATQTAVAQDLTQGASALETLVANEAATATQVAAGQQTA
ncbi:MAG TPA: hypothetical protein VNZ54_03470, partial [bacterium]|nr:hypothetical protein [bacterium]